jgi:hypothetical protein
MIELKMNITSPVVTSPSNKIKITGYGFFLLEKGDKENWNYNKIFERGIGLSLAQNVFESYKDEFIEKGNGNSIIPIDDFMLVIHYFRSKNGSQDGPVSLVLYLDPKDSEINYTKLYLLSKKITKQYKTSKKVESTMAICEDSIEIPRLEHLTGVFVIDVNGCPFFTMVGSTQENVNEKEVHISGFISAIMTFSKEIIGKESIGGGLKEINFGSKRIYIITKNNIIFAYLVDKMEPIIRHYIYMLSDVFLHKFKDEIKQFNGNSVPFEDFRTIIGNYFKI